MNPIDRHQRIALQLSGGKDSLACFYLLRPYWDKLTVYWVNTGAAFSEVCNVVGKIANIATLIEIKTDQAANISIHGYPVDVLPIRAHASIQPLSGDRLKMQGFMQCCYENVMRPMQERMVADGITLIIRGQRNDESHKSTIKSGYVSHGTEYYFPIESWTSIEVLQYLREIGELPEYYNHVDSSLDCWNCTAYLSENLRKRTYMRHKHPEKYAFVSQRLTEIATETERDLKYLRAALEA